jgi:ribose transport system ATP-binding protein/rhamnose transport system ATP-binding protein
MLNEISYQTGGAGFWALIDQGQLICLNMAGAKGAADPGFAVGEARSFADTRIPAALGRREAVFVSEADGGRATMLLPLRSSRGHDLGWVGLTVPGSAPPPSPEAVRGRIETLAATL